MATPWFHYSNHPFFELISIDTQVFTGAASPQFVRKQEVGPKRAPTKSNGLNKDPRMSEWRKRLDFAARRAVRWGRRDLDSLHRHSPHADGKVTRSVRGRRLSVWMPINFPQAYFWLVSFRVWCFAYPWFSGYFWRRTELSKFAGQRRGSERRPV